MKIAHLVELVCIIVVVSCIGLLCKRGLNWGLDFTGGVVIEVQYPSDAKLSDIREALKQNGVNIATVQNFESARDVSIRLQPKEGDKQEVITRKLLWQPYLGENERQKVMFPLGF